MEHYKIPEEKIEALIRCFETSGFWPQVIVRKVDGKFQKAFGHARTEAGSRLYGPNHKIEVIVQDLSDEKMLKMMADENGELWGSDFLTDMETVQATIKAYADGKIKLEIPYRGARRDKNHEHPYTAFTVAKFHGWLTPKGDAQERVDIAIRALALIEEGVLKIEQFESLGNRNARVLVEEADVAKKRIKSEVAMRKQQIADAEQEAQEAKSPKQKEKAERKKRDLQEKANDAAKIPSKVGEAVSTAMRTGKVGYREARKVTNEVTDGKIFKPVPLSGEFISLLCRSLATILSPYSDKERMEKIQAVIDAKDILPKEQVQRVAGVLTDISDICLKLAVKLNTDRAPVRSRVKALPLE